MSELQTMTAAGNVATIEPALGGNGEGAVVLVPPAKKKAKKPTLKEYVVPDGGLQSSETPGFDIATMKQLKEVSFADLLDYHKWRCWYFEQRLLQAEKARDNVQASGTTSEERKSNARTQSLMDQLERQLAELAGQGKSNPFADRIGKMYAAAKTTS